MAYKAVFINESHIAHAGYKEDWQGKWHGSDGTYQVKPEWAKANSHFGKTGIPHYSNYAYSGNSGSSNSSSSNSGSSNSSSSNSSSTSNNSTPPPAGGSASNTNTPPPQTGPINYKRGNPYLMTNDQLRERNTRATLINNYNKNYPSVEQQFQEGAQKANQLVNSGAQFAKSFVREPSYTRFDLSGLSNEELARANERARLENQYNQYYNPPKEDHTKEWIDRAAQGIGLAISAAGVAVPIILAAKGKKGN